MKFGIIRKFIAWFKKIFYTYQREGPQFEDQSEKEQKLYNDEEKTKTREPLEIEEKKKRKVKGEKRRKKKDKPYEKKPPTEPTKVPKEKTANKSIKPPITTRIAAPFVELDLNEAKVFLVIPKQIITKRPSQKYLNYWVKLNDDGEPFQVDITEREKHLETAEKRIELKNAMKNFEVIYPSELENRTYRYNHQNDFIYFFIAVGNNLGRMHYIYDINGNINPLPQKEIWVLLKEGFELDIKPDAIEDTWVWENYRPLCINLKNVNRLVVRDRNTNEEKVIPCQSTFYIDIDSEEVAYDDFGEQSPIFTDNSIRINASAVNEEGWIVWIQNKQAGYKIVSNNWSGRDPLKLKLANDLPCECGEFQVDICKQNGESVVTLFFRYIPSLRLSYPKKLIIPDSKKGHNVERIEVLLQDSNLWKIETSQQISISSDGDGYIIDLPPEEDTIRFSIFKKNKPETTTTFRVTIPRLKWKTSSQEDWIDKPLHLKREELASGGELYLFINTNSSTKYDILASLEANNQRLQESKFVRQGKSYKLLLNQFYDTIENNTNEIALNIKIFEDRKVIGENICVIHFPEILMPNPIPQKLKKGTRDIKPVVKGGRGMRKGRGFSKGEILQAGIKIGDIKRLNIPYDKRRKSVHPQNIETLKSLIGSGKHANRSN